MVFLKYWSGVAAAWVVAVAILLAAPSAAQPRRVAFVDGDGQWRWADLEEFTGFATKGGGLSESIAGPFRIVYQDVEEATGVGFDDPELGQARRATLWAVLDYMASVLDVPGQADLFVRASQTDGLGALAAAGPFLAPESGFQGGFVFEHLQTGVDPVPDTPDGTVSVDFGFRWNAELDAPAPDEHDLFTTLLHEVTHALGFFSVVASDGRSELINQGDRGLFSIFDSLLLREADETPVFFAGGEVAGTTDDFAGTALVFAGERVRKALGFYPRVFTPRRFLEGSSIGHWSSFNGFDSVMLPGLASGIARRRYAAWELQALADLGYDVIDCGDGFIAGEEECDDGKREASTRCTPDCLIPALEPFDPIDGGIPEAPVEGIPGKPSRTPSGELRDPSAEPLPEPAVAPTSASSASGCQVHPNGDGVVSGFALVLAWILVRRPRDRTSRSRS